MYKHLYINQLNLFTVFLVDNCVVILSSLRPLLCQIITVFSSIFPSWVFLFLPPGPEQKCKSGPVDLVFLIDSSRSVRPHEFETMRKFMIDILATLDIGLNATRVGVVQYSSQVLQEHSLTHVLQCCFSHVSGICLWAGPPLSSSRLNYYNNYRMDCHEIWFRRSCSPQDRLCWPFLILCLLIYDTISLLIHDTPIHLDKDIKTVVKQRHVSSLPLICIK